MNAQERYRNWINDSKLDQMTREELLSIEGNESEIEDRFYMDLEFGTAGLRGVIGAGTNRMNKYTVAKATQGLADYINEFYGKLRKHHDRNCSSCGKSCDRRPSVAIAYDSRHMSREFSDITAAVLNANGIKTYVFEDLRPTPELSFAIRHLGCIAGVNVTASHNPKEYNGYKVYWADGAQVTPPHDEGIMACVNRIENIFDIKAMSREEAEKSERYVRIGRDIDEEYMAAVSKVVKEPDLTRQMARDVKIAYSPLHGAGIKIVPEILKRFGFTNLYIVKEQEQPDGDFPTVEFPNPEMAAAFRLADELGEKAEADIIIATDPDADRIGLHVRDGEGNYHSVSGNLIGCLLCEYELSRLQKQNRLPRDGYVVRSIVSSKLFDRIAEHYGVQIKAVLTGFKNIGAEMLKSEMTGEGTFLFGYEESYGYLPGTYARDKDACATALVLSELCAYLKYEGETVWDMVQNLYKKYGYTEERTVSVTKKGIKGLAEISNIMENMRKEPPAEIGGLSVKQFIDYNQPEKTGLNKSNVLYFVLDGAWVCVRPSGTEPKIKYYIGVTGKEEADVKEIMEKISGDFLIE